MEEKKLLEWLSEGPFTLALSSSFFGFFAHCGIVDALWSHGIRPARITGSSAGALVGGALASGLEPQDIRELLFSIKKTDFWDPHLGFGLLRGKKFLSLLDGNIAPFFSEAKIPLSVAVFDLFSFQTRFLNEGAMPLAIVASCSVPLMFHPVKIGSRVYFDGGVFHKSGVQLLHPDERTLCVFLQNSGLADSYEWGQSLKNLGANQRVLRFKNLPKVNYNSLSRGHAAYAEAEKRARAALARPLGDEILDA